MTDNKEIPQEVMIDIAAESSRLYPEVIRTGKRKLFNKGAEYGYLLSQQALEEKDKRIMELEVALQAAVDYEERTRKVMCDVNNEFGFKEPEQLKWVKQAVSVLPPKPNHKNGQI